MARMEPGSLSAQQGAGNTTNPLGQAAWLHQAGSEIMKEKWLSWATDLSTELSVIPPKGLQCFPKPP